MSDQSLSDIDFENKMAWVWSSDSELPLQMPNRTNSPNNNCPAFGEPCLECENSSSLHLLTRFSEAHSISSVVYIASSCLFNTQLWPWLWWTTKNPRIFQSIFQNNDSRKCLKWIIIILWISDFQGGTRFGEEGSVICGIAVVHLILSQTS